MIDIALELDGAPLLDNPVWAALTGPQAGLALAEGRARRFPPDVSPLAALPDDADEDAWRDMAGLVGPGGVFLGAGVPLPPPAGWTVELELPGVQLVAGDAGPRVAATPPVGDVVPLGARDVPEMVDLVARTEPGPFAPRTVSSAATSASGSTARSSRWPGSGCGRPAGPRSARCARRPRSGAAASPGG